MTCTMTFQPVMIFYGFVRSVMKAVKAIQRSFLYNVCTYLSRKLRISSHIFTGNIFIKTLILFPVDCIFHKQKTDIYDC